MIDYFASGSVSSFLSWVFGLPLAISLILGMFSFFGKQEGIPWPLSAWVGLCMIIFAPVRYILFILVLGNCYVVQSFSALFCAFVVSLYFPLVILVLVLLGLGIPSASLLFYQSMKKHPFLGGGFNLHRSSNPMCCRHISVFFASTSCSKDRWLATS